MQIRQEFKDALKDYLFLLEKNYPQKALLKLVSDRYRLNTQERSMLFRGVVTESQRKVREENTVDFLPDTGLISIDGFNVLRTVASYTLGRPVFIAMDGFIRDSSELHGKPLDLEIRIKAFSMVLNLLKNTNLEVKIWFDSPVSKSGETSATINKMLKEAGVQGNAETVHYADYELKNAETGIIATADSAIIENSKVKVVDLARLTLESHFSPRLVDLRQFI